MTIVLRLAALGVAMASSAAAESIPETALPASEPETSVVEEAPGDTAPVIPEEGGELDWKAWLAELVSPQTLATVTAIVTALVSILKMVATTKRLAKEKALTAEEVSKAVLEAIGKQVPAEIKAEMDKYAPLVKGSCEKFDRTAAALSKIAVLSQQDTPEAKLAILSLVQELGSVGNETIEEAKKAIEAKAAEEKEAEKAKESAVKEVIEETSSGAAYDGTSV